MANIGLLIITDIAAGRTDKKLQWGFSVDASGVTKEYRRVQGSGTQWLPWTELEFGGGSSNGGLSEAEVDARIAAYLADNPPTAAVPSGLLQLKRTHEISHDDPGSPTQSYAALRWGASTQTHIAQRWMDSGDVYVNTTLGGNREWWQVAIRCGGSRGANYVDWQMTPIFSATQLAGAGVGQLAQFDENGAGRHLSFQMAERQALRRTGTYELSDDNINDILEATDRFRLFLSHTKDDTDTKPRFAF